MTRELAESRQYLITSEYESVFLNFKDGSPNKVLIGDFYGDPNSAIITENEEYGIIIGAGIIIYALTQPFKEYSYKKKTQNQYKEYFREKENMKWLKAVKQKNSNLIIFITEDEEILEYNLGKETFELPNVGAE